MITAHPSGTCSPARISATGFPWCWVEIRGPHPHPSGTAEVCERETWRQWLHSETVETALPSPLSHLPDQLVPRWNTFLCDQRVPHSVRAEKTCLYKAVYTWIKLSLHCYMSVSPHWNAQTGSQQQRQCPSVSSMGENHMLKNVRGINSTKNKTVSILKWEIVIAHFIEFWWYMFLTHS